MRAAPVGKEILIKASTEKIGSNVAFLTVDIVDKASGKMVIKGTHTKFLGGAHLDLIPKD